MHQRRAPALDLLIARPGATGRQLRVLRELFCALVVGGLTGLGGRTAGVEGDGKLSPWAPALELGLARENFGAQVLPLRLHSCSLCRKKNSLVPSPPWWEMDGTRADGAERDGSSLLPLGPRPGAGVGARKFRRGGERGGGCAGDALPPWTWSQPALERRAGSEVLEKANRAYVAVHRKSCVCLESKRQLL